MEFEFKATTPLGKLFEQLLSPPRPPPPPRPTGTGPVTAVEQFLFDVSPPPRPPAPRPVVSPEAQAELAKVGYELWDEIARAAVKEIRDRAPDTLAVNLAANKLLDELLKRGAGIGLAPGIILDQMAVSKLADSELTPEQVRQIVASKEERGRVVAAAAAELARRFPPNVLAMWLADP